MVGRVGRVLTVIGVVLTAADLDFAARQSINRSSFRPLGVETIRQTGGWAGVFAGVKIGAATGALFGIETGPGVIATGAIESNIYGAVGYFSVDLIITGRYTGQWGIIFIPRSILLSLLIH